MNAIVNLSEIRDPFYRGRSISRPRAGSGPERGTSLAPGFSPGTALSIAGRPCGVLALRSLHITKLFNDFIKDIPFKAFASWMNCYTARDYKLRLIRAA